MANIKFFRKDVAPSNPQEGYVWFNSSNGTIQLYKSGNWEVYTGKINNVTYSNGQLTIVPHVGDSTTIDLSTVANISDLSTRLGNLETSFSTLSGEFETLKGTVSTNSAAVATVIKQLKNIQDVEGAVKTYVDNQISTEKTARENADKTFTTQISGLNTTTGEHTSAIADLKTFVAFSDGVNVPTQITNAINALDNGTNGVSGTGEKVTVTVKQENGKVTSVTVADSDIASAQSLSNEITRATNKDSELEGAINTEKGRVDKLVGSDANKSVRTIANEELAAQLLAGPDGAVDNFKTLQELAAWLEEHPESAAAMNQAIEANTTAITAVNTRIDNLDYTDTAVAKQYVSEVDQTDGVISVKRANLLDVCDEKGAADAALTSAKAYTDQLANGQVSANTTAIATNTSDITTIKGQITTINTTIEENELVTASALTNLDERLTELSSAAVTSVTGSNYITTSTTDGAVTVSANTGSVSGGAAALALASDVKSYVDSMWTWGEF